MQYLRELHILIYYLSIYRIPLSITIIQFFVLKEKNHQFGWFSIKTFKIKKLKLKLKRNINKKIGTFQIRGDYGKGMVRLF